jgi:large subunit ribosomal protein L35
MPKMKTCKSIAKRVKITGRGKVKRYGMGKRHLMSAKTSNKLRRMRRHSMIAGADIKKIKIALPYA